MKNVFCLICLLFVLSCSSVAINPNLDTNSTQQKEIQFCQNKKIEWTNVCTKFCVEKAGEEERNTCYLLCSNKSDKVFYFGCK